MVFDAHRQYRNTMSRRQCATLGCHRDRACDRLTTLRLGLLYRSRFTSSVAGGAWWHILLNVTVRTLQRLQRKADVARCSRARLGDLSKTWSSRKGTMSPRRMLLDRGRTSRSVGGSHCSAWHRNTLTGPLEASSPQPCVAPADKVGTDKCAVRTGTRVGVITWQLRRAAVAELGAGVVSPTLHAAPSS